MSEGHAIPGEGEGGSLNPEVHQQAVVERARSKGWKPLEEYSGDAAEWVDAKEFVGRQRLFDTIHDQKREIKKLHKDIETISKTFDRMEETAYKKALNELKDKQAQAVENQDVIAVQKTTEQITVLEKERAEQRQQVKQGGGESEEFVEWRGQNKWFTDDAEMREDAISIGVGYAAANPNKTQKEVLEHVTKRVQKMYPENFGKPKPVRREPVVESGSGTVVDSGAPSSGKSGKLKVSDLNEVESATMKTFIKRGVFKDAAKAAKMSEQEYYLSEIAKNR